MFESEYYSLDALQDMLGIGIGRIINLAIEGKINLKISIPQGCNHNAQPFYQFISFLCDGGIEPIKTTMPSCTPFEVELQATDSYKRTDLERDIKPFLICAKWGRKSNGDDMFFVINFDEGVHKAIECMLVDLKELSRIKDIKSRLDGKPTTTQLEATIQAQQEEIERLKVDNEALALRVTQLESKQSTDNSEPAPRSKTSINAFFKALNAAYPNINVDKIIKHSDGNISDKTIYKYLKDGI